MRRPKVRAGRRFSQKVAVGILAGGRSSRMGRDKALLRLEGKSLLTIIRRSARATGWAAKVRVVRRDLVPRCGPLGGIHAALASNRAGVHVFLACDMPFVSTRWLRRVRKALRPGRPAVFSAPGGVAGFPCVIRRAALPVVEQQIARQHLSLQALARALGATLLRVPLRHQQELLNVNTPEEWTAARRLGAGAGWPGKSSCCVS